MSDVVSGPASAGPAFDLIATVVRVVAGLGLIFLTILVVAEVASRLFINASLNVVEELAGYLVVALTFLGASLALRDGAMFRVGFLFEKLPSSVQRWLALVYSILALSVCGVLIWQTCRLVASSYSRGNVAPTVMMTPLWIPQMLLPFGLLMIAVFLFERALIQLGVGGKH